MLEIKTIVAGELEENTYIVYKNGMGVVIDPGYASNDIIRFIKEKGIDLKYILLTHAHYDHIGSAERIKSEFGADILCSSEEEELLASRELNLSGEYAESIEIKADGVFADGDRLSVGDMDFEFMITPGHTKGSSVIFCEDCVFTGDTLFSNGYGRCDLPTGNFKEMMRSLRRLHSLEFNYKVYPGHGESSFIKRKKGV